MAYIKEEFTVKGLKVKYKNFEGRETDYNAAGRRNFNIVITDPDYAAMLKSKGFNVKEDIHNPDYEYEGPRWILKINVGNFSSFGGVVKPKIVKIIEGEQRGTILNEETLKTLDKEQIIKVDLTFTPYDKRGERKNAKFVQPYLDTMYVTVRKAVPNPLDEEYKNIDINSGDYDELPF